MPEFQLYRGIISEIHTSGDTTGWVLELHAQAGHGVLETKEIREVFMEEGGILNVSRQLKEISVGDFLIFRCTKEDPNQIVDIAKIGKSVSELEVLYELEDGTWSDTKVGTKTTVVTLIMRSGFEVTATAACVDPAAYDHAIGVRICKGKIGDKLWELLGFLRQSMNG